MATIKPIQCLLGRMAVGWGVRDLARKANMSPNTVVRFERGETVKEATILKMQTVLEKSGVVFIEGNGGGVGVRLRRK